MTSQSPTLVRTGAYASVYKIEVDGVSYIYNVRHDSGAISGIRIDRSDARGGLKSGSKLHSKVLAAIKAAAA